MISTSEFRTKSPRPIRLAVKLYNTWRGSKERCNNPNHKNYVLYKDRWHEPWNDYAVFRKWALETGFTKGMTIDRIDARKGYHPDNCQWLTAKENTIKGNKERVLTKHQ